MILLMLSRQRSGTGAIASVLERNPLFVYETEILDPTSEESFFLHLEKRGISCKTPYEFCDRFKKYISDLRDNRSTISIIDIKYNSLGAFCPPFYSFTEVPWILHQFSQLSVPILHLVRPDLLDVFASGKLAEANGVWHARPQDQVPITRIRLNIREFRGFRRTAMKEDAFFKDFFSGYGFHLELSYYECFTKEGELSETALASISQFLRLDLTGMDRRPRFIKQTPWDISDKIENYREMRELATP